MKVFFDTNVYIAESLLGGAAEEMIAATIKAHWRIYCNTYVLEEVERVLTDKLGFSRRLGRLTRYHVRRRAKTVTSPAIRHAVPHDPSDSAILSAAMRAAADLLVTNDVHLLALNPHQSLRIISMTDYYDLMVNEGYIAG